jgi:hypothetical protein
MVTYQALRFDPTKVLRTFQEQKAPAANGLRAMLQVTFTRFYELVELVAFSGRAAKLK